MDNCVFCTYAKDGVPEHRYLAETEHFLAFLDWSPVSPGHTLIIPKKHSVALLDSPAEHATELFIFMQSVASAVLTATRSSGFHLHQNNGKDATQSVFHTHFHIIPRRKNDGLPLKILPQIRETPEYFKTLQEKVKEHLETVSF